MGSKQRRGLTSPLPHVHDGEGGEKGRLCPNKRTYGARERVASVNSQLSETESEIAIVGNVHWWRDGCWNII